MARFLRIDITSTSHCSNQILCLICLLINIFRQFSQNSALVDNLTHITPTAASVLSDFTNKLITGYPPRLWIKEQLFQIHFFDRLRIQQKRKLPKRDKTPSFSISL